MVSKGNTIESDKLKTQSSDGKGEKRKSRLAFGNKSVETDNDKVLDVTEQERNLSLLHYAFDGESAGPNSTRLMSNKKVKLQSGGKGSENDVQKRMMDAAMMMQTQEYSYM